MVPTAPRALLLDFGGVLVDDPRGRPELIAETVEGRLAAAGVATPDTLGADLVAALVAYRHRCEATVRMAAPTEITHREFWAEYVAADWPADARTVVTEHASALCLRLGRFDDGMPLRQGIREMLDDLAGRGVPVGIVSNTLCGAAHREYLAHQGLDFGVQLYSDEEGIRKPNPELIRRAAKALGVVPEECWYVGDTWTRDVRCGVRAGVGTTVLMHSSRTATEAPPPGLVAGLVVADPLELRAALA